MVIVDDYSRYPVVERLMSLKAGPVIAKLQAIFSMFGMVSVVCADNGPYFNTCAFKQFAGKTGFVHRKITPLHPMGNAIVENSRYKKQ
jgi:hypothetical protein